MLMQLFAFAAGFLLILGLGMIVQWALSRHPDLTSRFDEDRGRKPLPTRVGDLVVEFLAREAPRMEGLRGQIAKDLIRAGRAADQNADLFLGRALAEGLAVAVVLLGLFQAVVGRPLSLLAIGSGLLWTFGFRPHQLAAEAQARARNIDRRLPYGIDLSVLILEAGGTLREALEMLSEDREGNPLAEEIAIALTQIRSGASQPQALIDMAKRTGLEDMQALVMAINRGEETGAPMSQALQTQAELFRFRRIQKAEKLAVEAPVKMMFPNMIIMMAVLLIVLGPVLVKLVQGGML